MHVSMSALSHFGIDLIRANNRLDKISVIQRVLTKKKKKKKMRIRPQIMNSSINKVELLHNFSKITI